MPAFLFGPLLGNYSLLHPEHFEQSPQQDEPFVFRLTARITAPVRITARTAIRIRSMGLIPNLP